MRPLRYSLCWIVALIELTVAQEQVEIVVGPNWEDRQGLYPASVYPRHLAVVCPKPRAFAYDASPTRWLRNVTARPVWNVLRKLGVWKQSERQVSGSIRRRTKLDSGPTNGMSARDIDDDFI